jgi:hypothetical protein
MSTPSPAEPLTLAAPAPWPSLAFRRRLWLLYGLAWTVALLMPVPIQPPPESPLKEHIFTLSKALHVTAYALFTVLAGWMRMPRRYRVALLLVLIGHAMLTEWLQGVLENFSHRTGQWGDVGLDGIGIVVGLGLSWKWWVK